MKGELRMINRNHVIRLLSIMMCAITVFCSTGTAITVNAAEEDSYEITFQATVSNELQEMYNYIYIQVQNKETASLYEFNVYKKDNWCTIVSLPTGNYSVVSGGIVNDWAGNYPIEYPSFTVSSNGGKVVNVSCGSDIELTSLASKEGLIFYDSPQTILRQENTTKTLQTLGSTPKIEEQSKKSIQIPPKQALILFTVPIIGFALLASYMRKRRGEDL